MNANNQNNKYKNKYYFKSTQTSSMARGATTQRVEPKVEQIYPESNLKQ